MDPREASGGGFNPSKLGGLRGVVLTLCAKSTNRSTSSDQLHVHLHFLKQIQKGIYLTIRFFF